MLTIEELRKKLDNLTDYIKPHLPLLDSHTVTFISDDLWSIFLSDQYQNEFDQVSEFNLFDVFFNGKCVKNGEIDRLISQTKIHASNEHFIDIPTLKKKIQSWGCTDFKSLSCQVFMSSKKTHEVEVMSEIVAALTKATESSIVVDIGDGKGYLSSILHLEYKLNVLGIDSSSVVTNGAVNRLRKFKKHWKGIRRKIDVRYENPNKMYVDNFEVEQPENGYKQYTQYIESKTDIKSIATKVFPDKNADKIGLVGLHTCGLLSPVCLRQFVNNDSYSFLLNIGCCYHLLNEGFNEDDGFPVSDHLKRQKFLLGRNVRMQSLQAPERVSASGKVDIQGVFFRAVMEQLLYDKSDYTGEIRAEVGRLSAKCKTFVEYVRRACTKIPHKIELSDDELENYFSSYAYIERKLHFYYLVRLFLSPVVERIILYDRLLYLKEKGISESYLVEMFDPVVSPRCYGVLAIRTSDS